MELVRAAEVLALNAYWRYSRSRGNHTFGFISKTNMNFSWSRLTPVYWIYIIYSILYGIQHTNKYRATYTLLCKWLGQSQRKVLLSQNQRRTTLHQGSARLVAQAVTGPHWTEHRKRGMGRHACQSAGMPGWERVGMPPFCLCRPATCCGMMPQPS